MKPAETPQTLCEARQWRGHDMGYSSSAYQSILDTNVSPAKAWLKLGHATGRWSKRRSRSTTKWPKKKSIKVLECSSLSPDLNLTERLWRTFKELWRTSKTLNELKQHIYSCWIMRVLSIACMICFFSIWLFFRGKTESPRINRSYSATCQLCHHITVVTAVWVNSKWRLTPEESLTPPQAA